MKLALHYNGQKGTLTPTEFESLSLSLAFFISLWSLLFKSTLAQVRSIDSLCVSQLDLLDSWSVSVESLRPPSSDLSLRFRHRNLFPSLNSGERLEINRFFRIRIWSGFRFECEDDDDGLVINVRVYEVTDLSRYDDYLTILYLTLLKKSADRRHGYTHAQICLRFASKFPLSF